MKKSDISRNQHHRYSSNELGEYIKDTSWIPNIKKEVLIDLFIDENGPSTNYNYLKILSHGFDLKESFRKIKQ